MLIGFEKGIGFKNSLNDFKNHLNAYTVLIGTLPVFIICLTVGAVFVSLFKGVGLTDLQIASWKLAIYCGGGIISLILALYYKQPIVGAWSIPGMVLIAHSMKYVSYQEAIGAFLIAGIIDLLIGITGSMRKVVRYIPLPIMSAMIAGVLFTFTTRIITGFQTNIWVGIASVIGYYIFHKWIPKTPGILGTIIFGFVAAIITKEVKYASLSLAPTLPSLYLPDFSLTAFISIAIPLAILVLGAENMQAIGVLKTIKMEPPVNAFTIISGIGGIITSFFGGHNANIAGPTTALCAGPEAGRIEGRYVAAVFAGLTFIFYGIFAKTMVGLISFFPKSFNSMLIGLVMLPMVGRSFISAFQEGKLMFGVMAALIVAMSNITIFKISAPFWSLVFGCLVSALLEWDEYKKYIEQK